MIPINVCIAHKANWSVRNSSEKKKNQRQKRMSLKNFSEGEAARDLVLVTQGCVVVYEVPIQ